MLYEKKYLGTGQGNFDDADFVLQPNQWVNMENCRVGSTDKGVVGTVESVGSNKLLSTILPSVTFRNIGSVEDEQNSRIIYFLKDLYGPWDKIVCYDVLTGTFYDVLLANQVVGGFNFGDTSYIHSAKVINGWLYWPEGMTNEPRKIDIEAAIKMNNPSFDTDAVPYVAPVDWREITVIKPPPSLAPNITKDTDSGFVNNFIANESFMFAFQYIYYNNETSVVGTYSPASKLNAVNGTQNRIIVSMDLFEVIPQTVRIVNLIVRYGNAAFIIKTWDKLVASENTEIQNQNSGTRVLTFNFYNNITGSAISSDMILKPFDSVPVYSRALEIAKNRLFLGYNTEGYDTPAATSLSHSLYYVNISGATALNKPLIAVNVYGGLFTAVNYSGYYVYLTEVAPAGYYAIASTEQFCTGCGAPPSLPARPTTVGIGGLTFRGADEAAVLANLQTTYNPGLQFYDFDWTIYFVDITGTSISVFNIFKTRAQYKLGIVFYDYAMRKCGVATPPFNSSQSDPTLVNIPARNFNFTVGVSGIIWNLSNDNALNEIPEWAHYYTIVRTLNLRTRYFINVFEQNLEAKYVTRDADGNYVFTNDTYVTGAIGIGIDTTALIQAGLGYTFTEGDICYINTEGFSPTPPETSYTVAVIGQSGKYIIVNSPEGGIGDLGTFKFFYEIYTPYQASAQEPYYEVGEMYRILNPRTSGRLYSTLSGVLIPDAYVLTRDYDGFTYFAEAMSPNDRFFSRWDTDAGKVNYVVKTGQAVKTQNISFSNVFIPGTATNGLSTFEALDETNSVPFENGEIQKLILTSKTQDQGSVMLAVCTNETSSIYLGEARITDNTGTTQFLASSTEVIGTINSLKGSFGTINPESVIEFRGNVYWVDLLNGKAVQYSLNGLFPISNYKMTRYWKLFSEQYLSMTPAQIIALGNQPTIITTVDPHHWELLISVPKLLATPPMGYLPDAPYTGYVYPFDIWDGQAKTLVYKINAEPNYWQGAYAFAAEGFVTSANKLFSFKFGQLYEHNQTTDYCNFYGIQYKSRLMFVCNQQPERPKVYDNISIEGNMLPTLTYFMSLSPYAQVSNLQDFDYESKEGVLYSQIYRNVLTPSATGLQANALVTGEKMRTYAFRVMLEYTISTTSLELRFVTIGYQLSLGHTIPTK